MRYSLLFIFLFIGCSQKDSAEFSKEDYVLVEFASKLEEDYHKFSPTTQGQDFSEKYREEYQNKQQQLHYNGELEDKTSVR